MKCECGKNTYEKIAGKIASGSVFLAAVVLIFGGAGRDAIGGVAILCAFGLLVALLNKKSRSSCCSCCDCGCHGKEESKSVSVTKKSAKKTTKKKSSKKKK